MVMIVFSDVATPLEKKASRRSKPGAAGDARVLELEQELQQLHESLQTTREEMQSSQEELKSTNEELNTSREEMQSLNEELQTINAEQHSKMDALGRMNNDMRNLLNSTEIVTVFWITNSSSGGSPAERINSSS